MLLVQDRKNLLGSIKDLEGVPVHTWPEQDEILAHPARVQLVAGGERAGKSFLGALKVINHLDEYRRGDVVWLVARDYERTRAEWNYLLNMLGQLGLVVRSSKRIDPGVMVVSCGSAASPQDTFEIKTKSANDYRTLAMEAPRGIVACEASQLDHDSYLRLRGRIAEKRGWLFMEGTFEMSLGWYPSQWEQWQSYPNATDSRSFSLPSWTNQRVYPGGRDDPEVLALELIHSENWFNERIAGVPAPPKGLVHPLFKTGIHVDPTLEYIPGEPVHLWVDPGYSQITHSAYAVEAVQIINGQVRVFDEVYMRGNDSGSITTEDVIDRARSNNWWKDVKHGVIDVAAKAQSERRPLDVWMQYGGLYMATDQNRVDITSGIERYNTFLKQDAVTQEPHMIFAERCRGALSEMGGATHPFDDQVHVYSWKTDREGNVVGKVPRDAFNHAVKAITYGLVSNYGVTKMTLGSKKIKTKRWV